MKVSSIKSYLLDFQNQFADSLSNQDSQVKVVTDNWTHGEGGGGITKAFTQGEFIEKAGVNFSHVFGSSLPPAATVKRPELIDAKFEALGVSVIIHPKNPFIPTSHANVRFISTKNKDGHERFWFGGGFDLTPYYGFHEDCVYWHSMAKNACDPFGTPIYPEFKKNCDDYFFLKHRNEPRGIGGIFFDDLNWGFDRTFEFIQSVSKHFHTAYSNILTKRKLTPYTEQHRDFQLYRRGRYVEFNLLYDRGTLFGLQSGGRSESILMSLPPLVTWSYQYPTAPNSPESNLYIDFLKPREWLVQGSEFSGSDGIIQKKARKC